MLKVVVLGTLSMLLVATRVSATPVIINGDFETGTFAGWTNFTTPNGVANASIQTFDVDGDGTSSFAIRFRVGQQIFQSGNEQGGGIFQTFVSGNEVAAFHADIASFNSESLQNGAGGRFSLLIDSIPIDVFDFGSIAASTTERSTLDATLALAAGTHELRFLVTRPFLAPNVFQFIDDVTVSSVAATEVPEPASLLLFGTGLIGAGIRRYRRR